MSQPLSEPQYALMNNCEPCQSAPHYLKSAASGMVGVARVVSPQKEINRQYFHRDPDTDRIYTRTYRNCFF